MNQVADILKLADEASKQNIDAVLATVVHTEGSAYRRAGAMMLICADGRAVGMISGGCLEPHIIKRAFWLTRDGANVQVYQTGDEQLEDGDEDDDKTGWDGALDSELNFGLGCNGRVHVLFERLSAALPLLAVIRHVRRSQQPAMIATLIRSTDDKKPLPIGTRLNLQEYIAGGNITTLTGDSLYLLASSADKSVEMSDAMIDTVNALSQYETMEKNTAYAVLDSGDITTEWLIQRVQPQLRLLICGAGNDVMPLVTMAKLQDWHVTVADSRAHYATRLRFPQADVVVPLSLKDHKTLLELSKNAAIALMSHSLTQDRARLAVLLAHPNHYRYVGQLGPCYRTERLINEISATLDNPDPIKEGTNKLHYPIGYKLGGDGPEALALGIMAQITAVMHQQTAPVEFLDTDPTSEEVAHAATSSDTATSLA